MINNEFYPTPSSVIYKMLNDVDFRTINTVLEPSAGKGDIVSAVKEKMKSVRGYYNRKTNFDIDTIEIDNNLRHILKGNGYRVVHDDFLTYQTFKRYDVIFLNPPFSNGDKHLLKALDIQKDGGKVVCLLNAETIRNPYTNTRKDLVRRLEEYSATIEYMDGAFVNAERKTNVEIALVKVDIPQTEKDSVIINHLRQREDVHQALDEEATEITHSEFIERIVEQYSFEVAAGIKLINEYRAMMPYMLDSFEDEYKGVILTLEVAGGKSYNDVSENAYIKKVRYKYWRALFQSRKFSALLTTDLREKYMSRLQELVDYDFSLYNIYQIRLDINNQMLRSVEDTIFELFNEFSHKHYWDKQSKNIHYYNGWKTNKSWVINKKVVIPLNGYDLWNGKPRYTWRAEQKLLDIEKVFSYLDGGLTDNVDLAEALKQAQEKRQTKKIPLKYFNVTFYKKGTCHIEFTNLELLKKFNRFGSQKKGWLPPSYGKSEYKDMSQEEKAVIDEFEGKDEYVKVMKNKDYYLYDSRKLLALPSA